MRLTSYLPSSKSLKILVVDDEFGTRASLGTVLALDGHHAVFADDGDIAMELFEKAQNSFDVIITDHRMYRVSGLDLARGLRGKGFAGKILVLTAHAKSIEQHEYKKLEVAGIMEKPFNIAELRQRIDYVH